MYSENLNVSPLMREDNRRLMRPVKASPLRGPFCAALTGRLAPVFGTARKSWGREFYAGELRPVLRSF